MDPTECLTLLGLKQSATVAEIKRSYRRLAQELHPDHNRGDERARRQFVQVAGAYRVLMRTARAIEAGREVGVCRVCLGFGELIRGTDGVRRCPRCTLFGPRRLLPLPIIVIATCITAITLIALASYLLVLAISNGRVLYAGASFLLGAAALVSLAHTCLTVVYCADRRQLRRRHPPVPPP